jgi:glutamyl-tRNA reductase
MQLLALSLNYRTAPVALRERVSFPEERALAALAELRGSLPQIASESAIVSTCNRTELYACVDDEAAAVAALMEWLAAGCPFLRTELSSHVRVLRQEEAARHAFRVASGLDSMVLGEPQILGQMKSAARNAQAAGTLGPLLHQLFQRAFAVAKEVRTRTQVGRGVVSHAAVSVELARGLFGELAGAGVLFIGAGAMIESVAPHFAAHKPREMAIANRTPERSVRLARRFSSAAALTLGELPASLQRFDIVVSCTGSMQPLLTTAMVQRSQRSRAGRPLLVVDLGVPRDVEPEVAGLAGVSLYTIDDLGKLVQPRASLRAEAAAQAEGIIAAELEGFMEWLALRPCVPLLRRLNDQVERLRAAELERARRSIAHGQPVEDALSSLAAALSNKLLHPPRTLLRGATAPGEAQRLLDHWVGALEQGVRL